MTTTNFVIGALFTTGCVAAVVLANNGMISDPNSWNGINDSGAVHTSSRAVPTDLSDAGLIALSDVASDSVGQAPPVALPDVTTASIDDATEPVASIDTEVAAVDEPVALPDVIADSVEGEEAVTPEGDSPELQAS